MRSVLLMVLLSLITGPGCGDDTVATPSEPKAKSGFDTNDDGWTIVGDAQSSSVKPDYLGTGGNPGGLICANDDVAGGVWYFKAPAKYLGDNGAYYGSQISFDIKTTEITDPFDDIDVLIEGGGLTLVYDTSPAPGETWTSYTVPLAAGSWKIDSLTGPVATPSQLKSALANVTEFRIRGEFNTGADTGCLDNVIFGAPR